MRSVRSHAFSVLSAVLLAALAAIGLGVLGTGWLVGIAAVAAVGMIGARALENKEREREKQAQAAARQHATMARLQREIDAQNAKERFIETQQVSVLEAFRQEHNLR